MENCNPMKQLPQLLEALLLRLEAIMAEQTAKGKESTDALLQKLKKQAQVMRTITSSDGEKLSKEMEEIINKVPVPVPPIFPGLVEDRKEK